MLYSASAFNQNLCGWGPAMAHQNVTVTDMFNNTACPSQGMPNLSMFPVEPLCKQSCAATAVPTKAPTRVPSNAPMKNPTKAPTKIPSKVPTKIPSQTLSPATTIVDPPTNTCGVFGLNLFCPRRGKCGFFRRLFNVNGCNK
jgi:hypothetical protein